MNDIAKRKVRSFVFDGEMREFQWLEDALDYAGGEFSEGLLRLVDSQSTVLIANNPGGPLPEEFTQVAKHVPEHHKHAFAAASMILFITYSIRHPVLVIDVGPQLVMIVTQASKLEAWVKERYRKAIPLKIPPINRYERWVVTIARDETCIRHSVGLAPRPDTPRA